MKKVILAILLVVFPVGIYAGDGCSPGYSCTTGCNGNKAICEPCPANTYQPNLITVSTGCTQCESGWFSTPTASACQPLPTVLPTILPTFAPSTITPTYIPTFLPTFLPTCTPTFSLVPTLQPTQQPSSQPSNQPSRKPSSHPTTQPTVRPSNQVSGQPSSQPTIQPTVQPSKLPKADPTLKPSAQPSTHPSLHPLTYPTSQPSQQPTIQPSHLPTIKPSHQPSTQPSSYPSTRPTHYRSRQASSHPTSEPTVPSCQPSGQPATQPSLLPSTQPSQPTSQPSTHPSIQPSTRPSTHPTLEPSRQPYSHPSSRPSIMPTMQPIVQPSAQPTVLPSIEPSSRPSIQPIAQPSAQPTVHPSIEPSSRPSIQPIAQPSTHPSTQLSVQPSREPSLKPSSQPSIAPSEERISLFRGNLIVTNTPFVAKFNFSFSMGEVGGPGVFRCLSVFPTFGLHNCFCLWKSIYSLEVFGEEQKCFHRMNFSFPLILNVSVDGGIQPIQISSTLLPNSIKSIMWLTPKLTNSFPFYIDLAHSSYIVKEIAFRIEILIDNKSMTNSFGIDVNFVLWLQIQKLMSLLLPLPMAPSLCNHSLTSNLTIVFTQNQPWLYSSPMTSFTLPMKSQLCSLPTSHSIVVNLSPFVQHQVIYYHQSFMISAVATLFNSSTFDNVSIVYSHRFQYDWSCLSTVGNESIISASKDMSVFRLLPYSMVAGDKYRLQVSVKDRLTNATGTSTFMWITCKYPPLHISLQPIQKWILLPQHSTVAITIEVRDPLRDNENMSFVDYSLQHQCASSHDFQNGYTSNGVESCDLMTQMERIKISTWSVIIRSKYSSNITLDRQITHLTFNVCRNSFIDQACVSKTVFIRVVNDSFPLVQVKITTNTSQTYFHTKPVVLKGVISVPFGWKSALHLKWVLYSPNVVMMKPDHPAYVPTMFLINVLNSSLQMLQMNSSSHVSVINNTASHSFATSLTLPAGVLVEAGHYQFRLICSSHLEQVQNIGSSSSISFQSASFPLSSAFADIEVWTNRAPFGGRFIVQPSSSWTIPMALNTYFTFLASSWADDSDSPMEYRFYAYIHDIQQKKATWKLIPNHVWLSFIEATVLPSGNSSIGFVLPLQCSVRDYLGAQTNVSYNSLKVYENKAMTLSAARALLTKWRLLLNISVWTTAIERLQVLQAMIIELPSTIPLSVATEEQLSLVNSMISLATNASSIIDIQDEFLLPPIQSALRYYEQLLDAQYLQQQATNQLTKLALFPSSGNTTSTNTSTIDASVTQISTVVNNVVNSLLQGLLSQRFSDGSDGGDIGSTVQTVQVSTETVRISLALITFPPRSNATNHNSSSSDVVFLPTITVPNSQNAISIAQGADAMGSAFVSVVEYDSSLWYQQSTNSSSGSGSTRNNDLELSSSIVSVRVSYFDSGGNGTASVAPSFVASLSVLPLFEVPVFAYNCTRGRREWRSFLCPESNVLMNVSCTGHVTAFLRRRCPVPQRVCSVLSLSTGSVASNDYCQASSSTASSGSTVTCVCGLSTGVDRNGSTSTLDMAALGGAVNVAVMTQFVAGGISGTVKLTDATISEDFAQQSMSIIITFGILWLSGLVIIACHMFDWNDIIKTKIAPLETQNSSFKEGNAIKTNSFIFKMQYNMKSIFLWMKTWFIRRTSILPTTTTVPPSSVNHIQEKQTSSSKMLPAGNEKFWRAFEKYIWSVLPSVYQTRPWWMRLWQQIAIHHKYLNALFQLIDVSDTKNKHTATEEDPGKETHQKNKTDSHQKQKSALRVLHLLTSITLACFVLAWLFDQQYPVDDGSCAPFVEKDLCLQRRSMLDSSRSVCLWKDMPKILAGVLTESRNGQVIQTIALDDFRTDTIPVQCIFNTSRSSGYVIYLAIMITYMFMIPVTLLLKLAFDILQADTTKKKHILLLAQKAYGLHTTQVHVATSTSPKGIQPKRRTAISSIDMSTSSTIPNTKDTQILLPSPGVSGDIKSKWSISNIVMKLTHLAKTKKQAPIVPLPIHTNRREALEMFIWFVATKRRKNSLSVNTVSFKDTVQSISNVSKDIKAMLEKLEFASDVQVGTCLLQTLISDVLTKEAIENHIEKKKMLFEAVIHRNFPSQVSVDVRLQYFVTFIVVASTLGALYFVALKGSTRNLNWQMNLLRVCLVEWCVEVFFYQIMEVYIVEFLVPNTLFTQVQTSAMHVLQVFLLFFYTSKVEKEVEKELNLSDVSVAVAKQYPNLWESDLVLAFHRNNHNIQIHNINNIPFVAQKTDTKNKIQVNLDIFLLWLADQSESSQRMFSYVLSSVIFAAMYLLWYRLSLLSQRAIGIVAMIAIVMCLASVLGSLWYYQHECQGYKSILMPLILPVVDFPRREEKENELEVQEVIQEIALDPEENEDSSRCSGDSYWDSWSSLLWTEEDEDISL